MKFFDGETDVTDSTYIPAVFDASVNGVVSSITTPAKFTVDMSSQTTLSPGNPSKTYKARLYSDRAFDFDDLFLDIDEDG